MRRSAVASGVVTALALVSGGLATATTAGSAADPPGGRTWFVATDGDDDGAGTSDDPFASWQRGIDAARDGDRVVVGPGTYSSGPKGVTIPRYASRKAPVSFEAADPDNRPVLDCSGLDEDQFVCVEIDARWWRISGVEIIGTPQVSEDTPYAVLMDETRHVTLENVAVHDNHGVGIALIDDSRHNLLRNVDAYRNQDELTDPPYENGDGIDLSGLRRSGVGNRVVGCRMWWNSDDGIDLWESEAAVEIRRSWSFRNGYISGTTQPAGNGQGFKLGRNFDGPQHVLTRNLAWGNRSYGFDENGASGRMTFLHNTSYDNGEGQYAMYAGLRHLMRNNVALPKRSYIVREVDDRFNSWTLPVRVTERDFRSTSWVGADGPRDPDGSLPHLQFLRLRAGSDLVDAGKDIGQPFAGAGPDLGAYERRAG